MFFLNLSKFTWKTYGVSIEDLQYNCLPAKVWMYEDLMNASNDYEYAIHRDQEDMMKGK